MTEDNPIVKLIRLDSTSYHILVCTETLMRFAHFDDINIQLRICGESLHKNWGYVSETKGYSYRYITFDCLDSAKECARRTLAAIAGLTCDERDSVSTPLQLGEIYF